MAVFLQHQRHPPHFSTAVYSIAGNSENRNFLRSPVNDLEPVREKRLFIDKP